MAARTSDWLKFGGLVALAFIFGLGFASALDLPRAGDAAERSAALQAPAQRPSIPAARPAADLGNAFIAVADHVKPAVVFIRSERPARATARRLPPGFDDFFPQLRERPRVEGTGSGFVVSPDGYILTNNHVVEGATRVIVRLLDKREFTARVVGTDANTDVAVIKIDAQTLPTVAFANSDSTRIGEWALAIGNPLGQDFTFTVTAGIVSGKGRGLAGLRNPENNYTIQDFIQTDAAINPGNSGGPLVNVRGEVIGINSAIASETGYYAGYGFAIPINLARAVMTQLIQTGHVERAILGISIREAGPEDADLVGMKDVRGVVVEDYVPADDSPAKRAGLKPGDVIVALDGQPVEYVAQLQQRVGFKKPGESVQVTVLREGGERRTLAVRLAAAPTDDATRVARNEAGGADRAPSGTREEMLGIAVEPLPQEDARNPRLRPVLRAGGGMLVTEVSPDGPGYQKLLEPADGPEVILSVNGKPTRTATEFRAALRDVKAGDVVTLQVYNVALERQRIVRLRAR